MINKLLLKRYIGNTAVIFTFLFFFPCEGIGRSKEHTVEIKQAAKVFTPEKLTIRKGDSVLWVNNDTSIPRHMFASVPGSYPEDEPEIKITTVDSGKSWRHTFKKAGRFPYFCFIHRGMTGEIVVEESK